MWEYTDKVKHHFINPRNVGEMTMRTASAKWVPLPAAMR